MEELTLECPFCGKITIKCIHKPQTTYFRKARGSAISKTMAFYSKEKYQILVDKCPNCGKSKKEIEKRLKEGKQPSNEEIIRRMKEAGLPLKIKG